MIYITQLIYIKEGQEKIFDEFEDVAIPIIAKYKGKLLFRVRPMRIRLSKPGLISHTKSISLNLTASRF
jgi:hypothetical protein